MIAELVTRLKLAIKDSELAGPRHGVVISKDDAKRFLYRLIKEQRPSKYNRGVGDIIKDMRRSDYPKAARWADELEQLRHE